MRFQQFAGIKKSVVHFGSHPAKVRDQNKSDTKCTFGPDLTL